METAKNPLPSQPSPSHKSGCPILFAVSPRIGWGIVCGSKRPPSPPNQNQFCGEPGALAAGAAPAADGVVGAGFAAGFRFACVTGLQGTGSAAACTGATVAGRAASVFCRSATRCSCVTAPPCKRSSSARRAPSRLVIACASAVACSGGAAASAITVTRSSTSYSAPRFRETGSVPATEFGAASAVPSNPGNVVSRSRRIDPIFATVASRTAFDTFQRSMFSPSTVCRSVPSAGCTVAEAVARAAIGAGAALPGVCPELTANAPQSIATENVVTVVVMEKGPNIMASS